MLWPVVAVFELMAPPEPAALGLWPTHWVGSANRPPFIKPQTSRGERQKTEKSSSPEALRVWLRFIF